MGHLEVRLLGGLSALARDGAEAGQLPRRAAQLLALLALAPGRRLARELCLEHLWPDLPSEAVANQLHKAASLARKALRARDAVVLRGGVVALAEDAQVDVDAFLAAGRTALRAGDPDACREALAAYSGELLPDEQDAEWARGPRHRCRDLLRDLLRGAGSWEELARLDPCDEGAQRALMVRSAEAGDVPAALRRYERLVEALADLDLQPSETTRSLYRTLQRGPAAMARARTTADLVGRRGELSRGLALFRKVASGRGTTLWILGEAGIGKTRLCEGLLAQAAAEGASTLRGAAFPAPGAPFAAVIEALDGLVRPRPDLQTRLSDASRRLLARLRAPPQPDDPPASCGQVFALVTQLLQIASRERPVVLLLDDLHHAHPSTTALVHLVARLARVERLLLVVATRPGLPPDLDAVRSSLLRNRAAVELELAGLTHEETTRLLRRRSPDMHAERVERIWGLAQGNPFFTLELARAFREGSAEVPRHLHEVVTWTLDAAPEAVRTHLEPLALLGERFDEQEFAAALGLGVSEVGAVLDAVIGSGLVVNDADGYRFRHALLRESVLQGIPPHRCRAGHAALAEALASLGAAPGKVARHLVDAGRPTDAVPWLGRAAREAMGVGAYADALAWVTEALETAPEDGDLLSLRAEALFVLGDARAPTGFARARQHVSGPATLALRVRQARAALATGDLAEANRCLEGMEPPSGPVRLPWLATRGWVAAFGGDLALASACAEEARPLAREHAPPPLLADVELLGAAVAHFRGAWPERYRADVLDTTVAPALAPSIHDGQLCIVEVFLYGGTPYPRIAAFAQELREASTRIGARRGVAFAEVLLGETHLLQGHLDPAEEHLEEGLSIHRALGAPAGQALSLQRLAEVAIARERRPEARDLLVQALGLAQEIPYLARHLVQRVYGTRVRAMERAEDAAAVAREARAALRGPTQHCFGCDITLAVPSAIALARAGDLDAAEAHLASARQSLSMMWRAGAWYAWVAEAESEIARAAGDAAGARGRLAEARSLFDQLGHALDARRCSKALTG